MTCALSW